uniref:CSON007014 protein n=1 Tax=Culicoides sonorensis TaxID=179676 RepID=A0A336N5Q0_CULSO
MILKHSINQYTIQYFSCITFASPPLLVCCINKRDIAAPRTSSVLLESIYLNAIFSTMFLLGPEGPGYEIMH